MLFHWPLDSRPLKLKHEFKIFWLLQTYLFVTKMCWTYKKVLLYRYVYEILSVQLHVAKNIAQDILQSNFCILMESRTSFGNFDKLMS